jgi:hypothetical protein
MDPKKIDELASIFAKEMKSEKDLNDLSKMLGHNRDGTCYGVDSRCKRQIE